MPDVISIHVGQAGVQIGASCWELYCLEHGIQPDGQIASDGPASDSVDWPTTLFSETRTGKFVPRAVLVDLDPTVVDEVRTGSFRQLFHPEQLISGREDAASNYARGHFTVGKDLIEATRERIRKVAEQSSGVQGVVLFHSICGGTGSGFGSLVLDHAAVDFQKIPRCQLMVLPSPDLSTAVVEPYNAVLGASAMIDSADFTVTMDNEALYGLCRRALDIERPTYTDLNRLIANVASSLTCCMRFGGPLHVDLNHLLVNLVPYGQMHFLTASFAPVVTRESFYHEQLSVADITNALLERANMMTSLPFLESWKYVAFGLMYRGDVLPKDVSDAIFAIKTKRTVRFVDWCPTGFKIGITYEPPRGFPGGGCKNVGRSVCSFVNTNALVGAWGTVGHKCDLLLAKRAFVHWYVGEGLDEAELVSSREDLKLLERDYEEIDADTIWGNDDDDADHDAEFPFEME
jgi:tubulin alpha